MVERPLLDVWAIIQAKESGRAKLCRKRMARHPRLARSLEAEFFIE